MAGYTKLFNSILYSTIWKEPNEIRIVWITMLAMADKFGEVQASIPGLAGAACVSVEECEEALRVLSHPDKYSRTKDHEGRRIEEKDGGWRILNHPKYRALMSADERREYFRIKKAEQRARDEVKDTSTNVKDSQGQSNDVLDNPQCPHIAEAEAKADTKAKKGEAVPSELLAVEGFIEAWGDFQTHRVQLKKRMTLRAETMILNTLAERPVVAVKAIELSIRKGWQDINWEWYDNASKGSFSEQRPSSQLRNTLEDVPGDDVNLSDQFKKRLGFTE